MAKPPASKPGPDKRAPDQRGPDEPVQGSGRGRTRGRDAVLGGRVQRGASIARLSAAAGAGFVTSKVRGIREGEQAEADFHAQTAGRLLDLLGDMKGAAMKLGQIASFVDLDLPPEVQATYHEVLSGLRTAAPPMEASRIAEVVEEQFGAPPEQVFSAWDPEPVASASIGQVHRARLPDGATVAVKVQYPGVAEAIASDLANAEAFAPMARLISPNLRIKPLMEELRVRLVDELDYQREAEYQDAFAQRYDGHPFIRVPAMHAAYCRPRVLTSDFVVGDGFEAMLDRAGEDERQRYGEIMFRFVFGSLHRFRLFNGDPHPGNYLFPGDGTVVFLDFGSVKPIPTSTRAHIQAQLDAVLAGDVDALVAALDEAGFLPARERVDGPKLLAWFRLFNRPILEDGPWTYTPEFAREVIRSTTDPRAGYVELLRKLNLPPDYLLLNRIQWGVNSILGRLRATANWHRISLELRGAGPAASRLGEEERDFIHASPYLA